MYIPTLPSEFKPASVKRKEVIRAGFIIHQQYIISDHSSDNTIRNFGSSFPSRLEDYSGMPGMSDRLEDYMVNKRLPPASFDETSLVRELDIYINISKAFGSASVKDLMSVCAMEILGNCNLRSVDVTTIAGDNGAVMRYPSACHILNILESAWELVASLGLEYPGVGPLICYIAILHAHPYRDGNGRVARAVFHLLLWIETGTQHIIPIKVISQYYLSAYLIKTRRAFLFGDLSGLAEFLASAIYISRAIQSTVCD